MCKQLLTRKNRNNRKSVGSRGQWGTGNSSQGSGSAPNLSDSTGGRVGTSEFHSCLVIVQLNGTNHVFAPIVPQLFSWKWEYCNLSLHGSYQPNTYWEKKNHIDRENAKSSSSYLPCKCRPGNLSNVVSPSPTKDGLRPHTMVLHSSSHPSRAGTCMPGHSYLLQDVTVLGLNFMDYKHRCPSLWWQMGASHIKVAL